MATKHCVICGKDFDAKTAWHRYCSRACESKNYRNSHGLHKLKDGRFCRQCGKQFFPEGRGGNNKQHCSVECSIQSARESRSKFWERFGDKKKQKMSEYYQKSRDKIGPDGNQKRFYSRYPGVPRSCQSCGEARVLDIAHKNGHARDGAHRSKENTTVDKVWILCPTCHALLDRMNYDPSALGLS